MVNMVLPEELPEELNILFDIMPLKLFELFFDDVIIDFIIKIFMNNNLYPSEIKVYPEMLILSGCNALRRYKTYC